MLHECSNIRVENMLVLSFCRGSLKYLIRAYHGAIEDLTVAIDLDPAHSAPAYFNRALCYQALGKPIKVLIEK